MALIRAPGATGPGLGVAAAERLAVADPVRRHRDPHGDLRAVGEVDDHRAARRSAVGEPVRALLDGRDQVDRAGQRACLPVHVAVELVQPGRGVGDGEVEVTRGRRPGPADGRELRADHLVRRRGGHEDGARAEVDGEGVDAADPLVPVPLRRLLRGGLGARAEQLGQCGRAEQLLDLHAQQRGRHVHPAVGDHRGLGVRDAGQRRPERGGTVQVRRLVEQHHLGALAVHGERAERLAGGRDPQVHADLVAGEGGEAARDAQRARLAEVDQRLADHLRGGGRRRLPGTGLAVDGGLAAGEQQHQRRQRGGERHPAGTRVRRRLSSPLPHAPLPPGPAPGTTSRR